MSQIVKTGQTVNAQVLRDELVSKANTKVRVYNLFKDLIDSTVFFGQIVQTTGNSLTNLISQSGFTNTLNSKIVQTTGNSLTKLISQSGITNILSNKIVQTTGNSLTKLISQNGITNILSNKFSQIYSILSLSGATYNKAFRLGSSYYWIDATGRLRSKNGVPSNDLDGNFSGSQGVDLITFNTVLTFDRDKDLTTVSGGTRTFTLAGSGHFNGVAIVARINKPVAVNFPVGFEAVNGSSTISTTQMNIVILRYFENYDGVGTAKVLYLIKNQTGF